MNPKEQFFFAKQDTKAEISHKLKASIPTMRETIKGLTIPDFLKLCEAVLTFADVELYTNYLHCYEVTDLENLSAKQLKNKLYNMESYRKTITETLILHNMEAVIVWFYLKR